MLHDFKFDIIGPLKERSFGAIRCLDNFSLEFNVTALKVSVCLIYVIDFENQMSITKRVIGYFSQFLCTSDSTFVMHQFDCKIISTPHGWSKEPDIKLLCYEMLNRAIFPFFDAIMPLSDELYSSLKRIPGVRNKLRLIRNGVDISEIDSVNEIAAEISALKEEGEFIIGYIGQLIKRKGLDILLGAVAQLPKRINWHLMIIGEGAQEKQLKALARSLKLEARVQFLGFRADRIALLKGFDVFVLPSRLEGIPRCLMEAMAAGVPIIATNIPGCADLVINQETGLLSPVDDIETLTKRIKEMTDNKLLRDSLTRAAREFVEQNFSAERMAREYEVLYASICHTRSQRF